MVIVVTDDGKLLLHHRDDKPGILHPGCWAGFGGAIEPGEDAWQAMVREFSEETGITLEEADHVGDELDDVDGAGDLVSVYTRWGGIHSQDVCLQEGAGVDEFSPSELGDLTITPFVERAIRRYVLPRLEARERSRPSESDPPASA